MRWLLTVLIMLSVGCASHPKSEPPPPERPSEWPSEVRVGFDLLRELVAINTSRPQGRRQALERLAQTLEGGQVHIEESRDTLVATLAGSAPSRAQPILLLAHIDTWPADKAAWPEDLGPHSAAIRGGELYGRGVLGGKGAAALFTASLHALARREIQRERPLWLVVTANGLDPTAQSLARVLGAFPALARTGLAIGPGGFVLRRPERTPETLRAVAVGERGFARLQLTALGTGAPIVLADAVGALPDALPRVEIGPVALRYLSDLAGHAGGIERWLMRVPPLARLLYTGRLASDPSTRNLVRTETRVAFVGATTSLPGDDRARAWVQAFLLGSEDPAGLRARLKNRLGPKVHVDLYDGEPVLNDPEGDIAFAEISRTFGGRGWVRTVGEPSQARLLMRIGIPFAGYVPLTVRSQHLDARAGPGERVPVSSVRFALNALPRALESMLGRPSRHTSTATLAHGVGTWQFR